MRLSPRELQSVRETLGEVDPDGRIYLFGSRADDSKKGGDIDIYFEANHPLDLKTRLMLEYRLSASCETKVDLLVRNPGQDDQPIFEIARKGILL